MNVNNVEAGKIAATSARWSKQLFCVSSRCHIPLTHEHKRADSLVNVRVLMKQARDSIALK
jgi:hypothetical protein